MREYGGDIHFICLEAQNLAKKRFGFKSPSLLHSNCIAILRPESNRGL